ncbi:hypothetical protein [Paenibacillus tengchongensis]|uniref:hypothetical protein n=1 Tax=Paenibacillus tengchongensis TaxID=2608684 RepID=UPI00124DBC28|nr:hypothetical protein [Paenibacillus tengchongensis]
MRRSVVLVALIVLCSNYLPVYASAENNLPNTESNYMPIIVELDEEESAEKEASAKKYDESMHAAEELNQYKKIVFEYVDYLDTVKEVASKYSKDTITQKNRLQAYSDYNSIIIPNYIEYFQQLNVDYDFNKSIFSTELEKINDTYILYLDTTLDGFIKIRDTLSKTNFKKSDIIAGFEKLDEAEVYYNNMLKLWDAYTKEYDLLIKFDDYSPMKIKELNRFKSMLLINNVYRDNAVAEIKKYNPITEENRKQAYISYNNVVIPNFTKFISLMKKIEAPNHQLHDIHSMYIKGLEIQFQGYNMFKDALYKNPLNINKLTAAWKKVNEGQAYLDVVNKNIKLYEAKYSGSFE